MVVCQRKIQHFKCNQYFASNFTYVNLLVDHVSWLYWYWPFKYRVLILISYHPTLILNKETKVVADTCRYSSGPTVWNIGINWLLEFLQVSPTTLVSLLFIYMIPIACTLWLFVFTWYHQRKNTVWQPSCNLLYLSK